mgnify:FL=1|jgi:hypothetical protein|tara:strand:- start:99 stop:656 length:558 start_codon:yes stop_codon:yes gene_type:complete
MSNMEKTENIKKKKGPLPVLSDRQKLFAEYLVMEAGRLSPTECARKAGYTNRPRQNASELRDPRKYPLVAAYIKELQEERRVRYDIDRLKHLQRLDELSHGAESKNQYAAAITGEVHRGKAGGLYIDKSISFTGSIEKMNREQLIQQMEELEAKNAKVAPSPFSELHHEEKHSDQKKLPHSDHKN